MNYIVEINNFYDWLETNPVSDSSIVLWHALMHINNKCGWKSEFPVAISVLQLKTGLSKSSIERSRIALMNAGRINFTSRAGQKSAVYRMFALHGDAQTVVQNETPETIVPHTDAQTVAQSEIVLHTDAQTVADPKLNNSSLINKKENPFFHIGTEMIIGRPSERINSDHSYVTDNFMTTLFRGIKKTDVLERLDIEYLGYQFRDENHLRNSFKTIGEKMLKESKPKQSYGKPQEKTGDTKGFVFGQKHNAAG